MFKTELTHEANCLYVSEIVFKMIKNHNTLPMNRHRQTKQMPGNKNNEREY